MTSFSISHSINRKMIISYMLCSFISESRLSVLIYWIFNEHSWSLSILTDSRWTAGVLLIMFYSSIVVKYSFPLLRG
jgi:hypothetical protein